MPIRGIIFDFDGTLLDSMGYWANASYQIMTENGVADPEAAFAVSEKHPLFDACQIWHDRFGARQQGPQMFERISAVMKDNYAHRIKPYPGERDFLDFCHVWGRVMQIVLPEIRKVVPPDCAVALRACQQEVRAIEKGDPRDVIQQSIRYMESTGADARKFLAGTNAG